MEDAKNTVRGVRREGRDNLKKAHNNSDITDDDNMIWKNSYKI